VYRRREKRVNESDEPCETDFVLKSDKLVGWYAWGLFESLAVLIAWEGNVHGPTVLGWLLLLPSSVILFVFDDQLGANQYHLELIAACILNTFLLIAVWHRFRHNKQHHQAPNEQSARK
jgi:hypothetical protein